MMAILRTQEDRRYVSIDEALHTTHRYARYMYGIDITCRDGRNGDAGRKHLLFVLGPQRVGHRIPLHKRLSHAISGGHPSPRHTFAEHRIMAAVSEHSPKRAIGATGQPDP